MSDAAVYPSLRDRAVLVTGGASGIGAAIVRRFAAQGARVAFLDVAEDAARALCAELERAGHAAPLFAACDVTDTTALRAAVQDVERQQGPVRVLVNNAANDDRHAAADVGPAYWDERMAVNLRHYFFAAQAVRAGMAGAGGGSIVNLGSISWRLGLAGMVGYATAKAAVLGLTKSLAAEYGPARIRVHCVEPGFVKTERQVQKWLTPEFEAEVLDGQSLRELIEPDDVAALVLFLASDDSRMCTGQSFIIDAGWV